MRLYQPYTARHRIGNLYRIRSMPTGILRLSGAGTLTDMFSRCLRKLVLHYPQVCKFALAYCEHHQLVVGRFGTRPWEFFGHRLSGCPAPLHAVHTILWQFSIVWPASQQI